jgi:hypothetical protein
MALCLLMGRRGIGEQTLFPLVAASVSTEQAQELTVPQEEDGKFGCSRGGSMVSFS